MLIVMLECRCEVTCGRRSIGLGQARCGAGTAHRTRLASQHAGLRGRQGLASAPARGSPCGARCTVERLMRHHGLRGVVRGKVVRTTVSNAKAPCPLDLVNRQFSAQRPNQLWVSDFTYVSTWQGWLYVAFVIDVFARRIVGWRVSSSMRTDFVFDALEQALYARQSLRSERAAHAHRTRSHPVQPRLQARRELLGATLSHESSATARRPRKFPTNEVHSPFLAL